LLGQTDVDVEPVEAIILDELDGRAGEGLPMGGRPAEPGKVGREGPASDREEDAQVSMLLLEQVELLEAAVEIGAGVVPAEDKRVALVSA
jgi:hypothetical protein